MSSNPMPVISFQGVWKKYSKRSSFPSLREDIVHLFSGKHRRDALNSHEFWALQNIHCDIHAGELVALAGPNGSGKSTLLKLIAHIAYATEGQITVNGRVAPIIELGTGFHPDLSGYENVFMNGAILGMRIGEIKQKLPAIIEFAGIKEFIHMPVKHYSSGMYLRLAFAVAIHSDADIFLFDEVIAVGDFDFQEKCIQKILELHQRGKTILFVKHDPALIQRLGARVMALHQGIQDTAS